MWKLGLLVLALVATGCDQDDMVGIVHGNYCTWMAMEKVCCSKMYAVNPGYTLKDCNHGYTQINGATFWEEPVNGSGTPQQSR